MSTGVHDSLIRVRSPKRLVDEAAAKAERDGMTFSELVRQALRREVKEPA